MQTKYQTKKQIDYQAAPYGHIATIPKGTPVIEARNLPKVNGEPQWWVTTWQGIEPGSMAESWGRSYGFLIENCDVEPKLTEQDQIRRDYRHDAGGRITQPGKFEGEPIFAPYYWGHGLEGFADFDDGKVYTFKFKNGCEDFKQWPELVKWLGKKRTLRLAEDSMGFVHCY